MKFFVKSPAPDNKAAALRNKPSQRFADSRLHTSLHDLIALRAHAHGFSLNPAKPIKNQFIGRHGSIHRGRGLNFEELAHYQHGDDIRTMDWKVTNRTGKPHVRVFTEEREQPVMLVCDQRVNMLFGSQHSLKSVVAAQVHALLTWRQFALSDAIATLAFNDEKIIESRPHRSQQMLLSDLGGLAELNQALLSGKQARSVGRSEKIKLSLVLDRLIRLCPRNYLIVLISDFADFDQRANQQIKSLALNNDVFAAHISDPLERELPHGKQFIAGNGELQLAIDTSDTVFTQAFNQHQQQGIERLRTNLNSAGITLMELDTVSECYKQLRRCIPESVPKNGNSRQARRVENG